jgi:beta-glucosidase
LRIHSRRFGSAVGVVVLTTASLCLAWSATSSARATASVTKATCEAKSWTSASYQASSTPPALAKMVLACLALEYPASLRYDEVGLVALNTKQPWLQNVNEFGNGSTVQQQLASLGIPPITLEDGPGGILADVSPSPTVLPNELALGATFDPSLATKYGTVLGTEAHDMGYDGVQAPDLNLVRVETWGRAMESFGESPVLAGEMGAAESVAIEDQHVIAVLKHLGPYSQETNRRVLNQIVSAKALQDLYVRPFTFVLRALIPQLEAGHHAVGIMCSYGGLNGLKACRSKLLADELRYVGVDALVRSDLEVKVDPSALVLNGVDLVKPMATDQLLASLRTPAVESALTADVLQIFETEFADGLVTGKNLTASPHALAAAEAESGDHEAVAIDQRAAVLLKNSGLLPLDHADGGVAVVSDGTLTTACADLAGSLSTAMSVTTSCTDDARAPTPTTVLYSKLPHAFATASFRTTFTAPSTGPYVVTVATLGNTALAMDGTTIVNSQGLAEIVVPRTALVDLVAGKHYRFDLTWRGAPPTVTITGAQSEVRRAVAATDGKKVAVVLAYDLAQEGMDRSSIELPGAQNAVIAALAAKVPTIVVLATDGAVAMPWLSKVDGVLEVWSPTGAVRTDATESLFVQAWTNLLDGAANPSGRLPVTFPEMMNDSPADVSAFWPGTGENVDLNAAPDDGAEIGMAWYRDAGWPVLFPFGFGLSYTTYRLQGGSVQSTPNGLTMTVTVADTGKVGGEEPVEVYGDLPAAAGEPEQQLVGFGVADFTSGSSVQQLTIPLEGDAFTSYVDGSMQLVKGSYCLETATYDGDPNAWSTGSVPLAVNAAGSELTTGSADPLTQGTCPD